MRDAIEEPKKGVAVVSKPAGTAASVQVVDRRRRPWAKPAHTWM